MMVEVKLFLGLEKHARGRTLPPKAQFDVREGCTVTELVRRLDLPENLQKTILVNGVRPLEAAPLQENDSVAIFPPMAGG